MFSVLQQQDSKRYPPETERGGNNHNDEFTADCKSGGGAWPPNRFTIAAPPNFPNAWNMHENEFPG